MIVVGLFLCTDQRDVDLAARDAGVDADGIIGAVLELEVLLAPVDRGVLTLIDVGAQ